MIKTFLQGIGAMLLIGALLLGIGTLMEVLHAVDNRTKVINCSIAEISPDFTNEMREACRKARMNRT